MLFGLIFLYGIVFLLLNFSSEISTGIKSGIALSMNVVIPSMFIFMIFSNIVINSPLKYIISKPFSLISRRLLKLSDNEMSILLLSLLGGYPIGARLLAGEVSKKQISSDKASKMLAFCVNGSPAFLINGIGLNLLSSKTAGLYLYIAQVISTLLIAFIMSFFYKKDDIRFDKADDSNDCKSLSGLIVMSVRDAISSMAIICGFTVAFCALMPIIGLATASFQELSVLIKGLLEVTAGCAEICFLPENLQIIFASIFISFGGICVQMQLRAILQLDKSHGNSSLSMKWFHCLKLFNILFCTSITLLFCNFCPINITPIVTSASSQFQENGLTDVFFFTNTPITSLLMLFLSIMLLFFTKKSAKI